MTVNLLTDIIAVLDADDAALTLEAAAVQAQIDALMAQLADIAEMQADSARFRALAASIADGSVAGSFVVPASAPPSGPTTPMTSGISDIN